MSASPSPPTSRRERQKLDREHRLYAAAMALFAKHGYDEVTVQAITNRADLSKGVFFNYFESKAHVLLRYHGELLDEFFELGRSLRGKSARSLFQRMFAGMARIFVREGPLAEMLVLRMPVDPGLRAAERGTTPAALELYRSFLQRGIDAGELPARLDRETAIGILSDIWLASLRKWVNDGREGSLEAQVRRKVDLAFRGLAAR